MQIEPRLGKERTGLLAQAAPDMKEEEKDMRQKWMFYLLAGVLAAGSGCTLSGARFVYAEEAQETNPDAEEETPDAAPEEELDAVAYVKLLCGGDVKELEENYSYTEEFLNAMETSGGFEALQESMGMLGELKNMGEPAVTEAPGYVIYSVPCEFAAMKLNLTITVDGQGSIAGVTTAEYQDSSEETADQEEEALPQGLTETELSLPVSGHEGWELPGTLTMPEGDGAFPAVVLVHGSGPNDRDESAGPNKIFRDLAWGLAEHGIAVYRYDKRTMVYAGEMAADPTLTLDEETVFDARDAVLLLRQQEKIDPDRVYVLGHSLGGEALPRIDQALGEDQQAAGYVFLAAPARDLAELMREQYDLLFSLSSESAETEAQKEAIYGELDRLENLDALGEDEAVLGAYKTYWEDLKNYDPVKAADSMTADCLVLQGEEDYQVTMEDYALWKDAFEEKENWEFISYPGLTHLFTEGRRENGNADYMIEQHVKEQVITDIGTFVNS